MRVTSEADYALRIMRCLTERASECGVKCASFECTADVCTCKLDARTISESIDAPQRFTVKILRRLLGGGFIRSYKGASGGYTLACDADEVSVLDILEFIDGPLAISRCLCEDYECSGKECGCCFHAMFREVNADMVRRLDAFKLSDAVKRKPTPMKV